MNKKNVFVRSEEDFNRVVSLLESYGERVESGFKYAPATENDHLYFGFDGWTYYNGIYQKECLSR